MHENTCINVLIVDDEKNACTNLENMLKEYAGQGINIIGIAHNTVDAEKQILQLKPDAVFLDIEMPKENAFHFLDRIPLINFEIVFVTSYNEYAIKAFRLNAVDYILKPISINELISAVEKLKGRVQYKKILPKNNLSFAQLSEQVDNIFPPNKIILKSVNVTEVVDFKNIYVVEAQSSYSKIIFHKKNGLKEIVMSNPLSDYEDLLPTDIFYRIHRSYLINCAHIKKIWKDGSNNVTLDGDIVLPISRRRHTLMLDFLKLHHYYND
jgi:two-component system, LytTR family, response regulator